MRASEQVCPRSYQELIEAGQSWEGSLIQRYSVSLRVRNFTSDRIKVNDHKGVQSRLRR